MGLFNKLKNVLFEEEEIEVPVEEPVKKPVREEKKVEKKKNVYDEEIKDEDTITTDRSIFKAEKTFDFPMFDDQEFEEMKNASTPKETNEGMGFNLFDYDTPKIKKEIKRQGEIKGRAYEQKNADIDSRKFKPSPVISPVYGILDKNYKKEDIVVKEEPVKKSINVDIVRKKAFGTLEDDIEKSLGEKENKDLSLKKENSHEKTIDELLEETSFDSIDLPDFKEEENFEKVSNMPIQQENDELEILDKPNLKSEEEKVKQSDTLENDLFDLIDSMYEDKEDES